MPLLLVRLLIVDEPFLGLDPLAISDLIELLAEEKRMVRLFSCRLTFWIRLRKCAIALSSCITVKSWHRGTLDELRQTFGDSSASLNDIYMQLTKGELS